MKMTDNTSEQLGRGIAPVEVNSLLQHPDALLDAWCSLLKSHAHLHPPEVAQLLDVPEAVLPACRIGTGATRLKADVSAILKPVAEWGRVLCAFSTSCGVHMPLGDVSSHVREDGVLCLQGSHMRAEVDASAISDIYLFVDRDESHGNTRSIQCFDAAGAAVLKVFIFHKSKFATAHSYFASLTAADQSRVFAVGTPTEGQFDARKASLSEDPDGEPVVGIGTRTALAEMLVQGGGFSIEAVGRHARAIWTGALSGVRFDERMFHIHEPDLRSHFRFAPVNGMSRTSSGGLTLMGEEGRLLRFVREDR